MKWLKKLLCFHSRLNSTEVNNYGLGGEDRITYSSPWALFGTREKHYKCGKCGGTYWEPSFEHNEMVMNEKIIKFLSNNQ